MKNTGCQICVVKRFRQCMTVELQAAQKTLAGGSMSFISTTQRLNIALCNNTHALCGSTSSLKARDNGFARGWFTGALAVG